MKSEWIFNRAISKEMVDAINCAYEKYEWIRQYLDDKELFLAIRDGYLNFYYKGNSILRLSLTNRGLVGKIHYKYLLHPKHKPEYISIGQDDKLPRIDPVANGAVDLLKKASEPYAGLEKDGVHKIIHANSNIIDVEIAFPKLGGKQNRIDFCALRETDGRFELCFYECKHFSNSELRAKSQPKVIEQIQRYRKTIEDHRDEIKDAYQNVFESILAIDAPCSANQKTIDRATGFEVSDDVRLVVFGFDQPQKDGFASHKANLIAHGLESQFILMKGNPENFTVGISK